MNQTSGCRFDEESHALGAHFRAESMAERLLQGQIAEVIELRDDGRVSVRFDNGRLLLGREAGSFERVAEPGLKEGEVGQYAAAVYVACPATKGALGTLTPRHARVGLVRPRFELRDRDRRRFKD